MKNDGLGRLVSHHDTFHLKILPKIAIFMKFA